MEIINKTLIINNKPRKVIEEELENPKHKGGPYTRIEGSYDHLLGMPIYSLTKEKVDDLLKQKAEKEKQLSDLQKKSH